MKEKIKITGYIALVLVLVHLILVAGCGKNPILGSMFSNLSVKVIRL